MGDHPDHAAKECIAACADGRMTSSARRAVGGPPVPGRRGLARRRA